MIKIPFSPQKQDYVTVPGLVHRGLKQAMIDFLIDTGASITMIDPDVMARIGYTKDCREYVNPASVIGPAGKEHGYRVRAKRVLIHSIECAVNDLDVVCIRPARGVEALLGLNFLKHFHYCIDHKNHMLTFQKL